eukprot:Anaeramoba_flamelloidesa840839_7.p1 GENE.a840839_7~~a840839_7.p1  ORF type:complete len:122 (-),score=21.17 a840839_7:37-402(-)
MREQYMESGEGFILVYSIIARDTFVEIPELKDMILRVKDESYFPMVVLGNKCDLESQRVIAKEEGQKFAESINASFFETSAKQIINVTESFYEIVRQIRKYNESKNLTKKDVNKKRRCIIL